MLILTPSSARAQFITIQAGSSSIQPSEGGTIGFHGANYDSYFGAGMINGSFAFGTSLKTTVHSYHVTLGDDSVVLGLPTDIFDTNYYFLTRGISVSGKVKKVNVFLFAGSTAVGLGAPFFQAAKANVSARMLFADMPLTKTLHFYTRNVLSRQQTSIEGLDWRPHDWVTASVAAGVGSNQPYFSPALVVTRDWYSVKASYVAAGSGFQRIADASPLLPEFNRENILIQLTPPVSGMTLIAGRQNLLQPQGSAGTPFLRATVNQLQGSGNIEQFRVGGGLFESSGTNLRNVGEAVWISRTILRNIDGGLNYWHSRSAGSAPQSDISASLRETVSPKLSLLQIFNDSQGHKNILFGGNYVCNRFTVGVDYQTIYLPFRANPFTQGIGITLQIRLPGGLQLNGQTFRDPSGNLRYTASASTLLTRSLRLSGGGQTDPIKGLKYVIRGHVRDQEGSPVEGAAIRIGQNIVYTNAEGEFLLRMKKGGVFSLEVALGEFLNQEIFEVVSAPHTAVAARDAAATDLVVVLGPARVDGGR